VRFLRGSLLKITQRRKMKGAKKRSDTAMYLRKKDGDENGTGGGDKGTTNSNGV